jgi:heptosyltransferase-2
VAERILVIRGGAIGDFVLTLPVLAALRKTFPQARLEILCYPRIASLAILGELAAAVHSLESPGLVGFFTRSSELNADWKSFFGRFDLILSFAYDPENVFERNIKHCTQARFISGPHRPPISATNHATEVFLKSLESLGIADADRVPKLSFKREEATLRPRVAAHPGSGSSEKNWPEAKWLAFLERLLSRTDADCLLLGGEAEGDRTQRFAAQLRSNRVQVASHLPLTDVAKLLTTCTAFVGHDSGISHLAAALDLPCLILWGQTNEAIWRPLGEKIKVLRAGEKLSELTEDRVLAELMSLLPTAHEARRT